VKSHGKPPAKRGAPLNSTVRQRKLFTMTFPFKTKWGLVSSLAFLCLVSTSCREVESRVDIDKAQLIARQTFMKRAGADTQRVRSIIQYHHPMTIDSFKTGAIHTIWLDDSVNSTFLARAGKYLEGREFWISTWILNEYSDANYQIYVDSKSGEVLWVDGMLVEKWWSPEASR